MPDALHLDRRAGRLAEYGADGAPDDLLDTHELAQWLAVSIQWLEIGRHRGGYGPPFVKIGAAGGSGRVRYRRSDVIAWLNERSHRCTSEYRRRARPSSAPTIPRTTHFVRRAPLPGADEAAE